MSEQSLPSRWAAAANWASAGGFGVGAIAEREGVTRIDALLAVAEEWARHPHLFTVQAAAVPPEGAAQCPECGIWFSDVEAHRGVHRRGRQRPPAVRRRRAGGERSVEPVPGGRPVRRRALAQVADGAPGPVHGRGAPITELPPDAQWDTWAEAANWAAANGLGPSRLADRLGADAASVTVAIIDAWSRDPSAFTVPAAVGVPGGALKQCPACGLWFASVENHVAAHGRISGRRRNAARGADREPRPEHDGHAAPRSAFEYAMERDGLLDHFLELRRCVLERLGPPQFRTRIGATGERAAAVLVAISGHPGYGDALGDLLRSRTGSLADDGDRVQCHHCGLWTAVLAAHLPAHDIEPAVYRLRYGLDPGDRLASAGMLPRRPRAPRRGAASETEPPALTG